MDEDVVFGAGLLDAYEAEQHADVPRVLLHESAVRFVGRFLRYYGRVADAPQSEYLFVDEDQQLVLDYLSSLWQDRTDNPQHRPLAKHRDVVSQRLAQYRSQPRIWAKYAWVARYHNYFCTGLPGGEQHTIDVSLFALEAKRLHEVIRTKRRRKPPPGTKKARRR